MKKTKINKKRIIAFILSSLLVMQQSLAYQVLAESIITDGAGNQIQGNDGVWNIRPDAVNGTVGFKNFDQIKLDKGDVLNFIYQWAQQNYIPGQASTIQVKKGDINTFVNLVNQGVEIHGIVNALQSLNGGLKSGGNLMFITPGGMVVGQSGVINVGNLSVVTPTIETYNALKTTWNLPETPAYRIKDAKYDVDADTGAISNIVYKYDETDNLAVNTTADINAVNNLDVDSTKSITMADGGRILSRGDVTLKAGTVDINGNLVAGVNDETVIAKDNVDAFNTLFNKIVNSENTISGNEFASTKGGNIVIRTNTGTKIGSTGVVKNIGWTKDDGSTGNTTISNIGENGINIAGRVDNAAGKLNINNASGELLVANTGRVNSNGTALLVENYNSGNMDIQGIVSNTNAGAKVEFINVDSDMKLGHSSNTNNITSNANVRIQVTNGNLLNNRVAHNLIETTNKADLDITVVNGSIGEDIGSCDGGICTGIGETARDLTKSINTSIDGVITANTKGTGSLINMASLNKDMHVNQIKAENGRVILLADDGTLDATGKKTIGANAYNIVNRAKDENKPNVEGTGISMIASGSIGKTGTDAKALTFRQTGVEQGTNNDSATINHKDHTPAHTSFTKPSQGVDMLAKGDIYVKGMDAENGNKLNTNVCAIISREGNINAEFSGDTYIKETTAANNINITTRGKNLYIKNLGMAPDTYKNGANDYYGPGQNITPDKVKLVALDLGSYWDTNDNPDYYKAADSTIFVENGRIDGNGTGRKNPDGTTNHDQDLEMVADNAYAGGYYFNMGKHRGEDGKSTVVKDPSTNAIKTPDGDDISIRAEAVRPEDVAEVGGATDNKTEPNNNGRNYYTGGSSQGKDPNYDGVDNENGNGTNDPDKQGTMDDDDNLVIPEPDEPDEPEIGDTDSDNDIDNDTDTDIDADSDTDLDSDLDSDTDSDTDIDTDTDNDTDNDTDTDMDNEPDIGDTDSDNDIDNDTDTDSDADSDTDLDSDLDSDSDSDTDIDTDTDNDTDNDTDTDMDNEPDIGDTDSDNDIDNDTDTDSDADSDTDLDNDLDSDSDSDTDIDTDTDNDTDNDTDTDMDDEPDKPDIPDIPDIPDEPTPTPTDDIPDLGKAMYKQRVVDNPSYGIDKRQYMRFNTDDNQNVVSFESDNTDVVAVTDISRGGVSLKHNKKLKVGDVVPVHLKYGDLEIQADVKIVSASDVKAGAQFINLDKATANKLLYLSLLAKDEAIAQTIQNISASSIDD